MYKDNKKAYIAITDSDWFEFIKLKDLDKVNFWTKSTNKTSLKTGDLFFFLKKKSKDEDGERKLVGYGIFERKENLTIDEAWNKYEYGNGVKNLLEFHNKLKKVIKYENQNIGCNILSNVYYFKNPLYLSSINIAFDKAIQAGKLIYEEDINKILNSIDDDIDYKEDIDFDAEFEEGNEYNRNYKSKKRSSKAKNLKLTQFKIKNGYIYCEVCKEDDVFAIDVHHDKVKISDMESNHKTKLSDLRVLCASCHRKVHGHKITVDELMSRVSNKHT